MAIDKQLVNPLTDFQIQYGLLYSQQTHNITVNNIVCDGYQSKR